MKKQKRSRMSKTVTPLPITKKSEFTDFQLMQALYWIWDAFDRSLMNMFVVYHTADIVRSGGYMDGERITVGVRGNEWRSGSTPILKSFTGEPVTKTMQYEVFKNPFNEVPVYVYIFSEDESITSPAQIFYGNEYFKIPNPYGRFLKIFGVQP